MFENYIWKPNRVLEHMLPHMRLSDNVCKPIHISATTLASVLHIVLSARRASPLTSEHYILQVSLRLGTISASPLVLDNRFSFHAYRIHVFFFFGLQLLFCLQSVFLRDIIEFRSKRICSTRAGVMRCPIELWMTYLQAGVSERW